MFFLGQGYWPLLTLSGPFWFCPHLSPSALVPLRSRPNSGVTTVTEVFRPGEKVIAHYAPTANWWLGGWYNGVIVRDEHDGNYIVRWEANRNEMDLPATSSVDPDEILT